MTETTSRPAPSPDAGGAPVNRVGFATSVRRGVAGWLRFSGRTSRAEYWWFVLFVVALSRIVDLGALVLVSAFLSDGMNPVLAALIWTGIQLVSLGWTLMALLSSSTRRIHDTGRSGWWLLVPVVNLVFLLSPTRHDNT